MLFGEHLRHIFARFQLTRRVARSLGDNAASCIQVSTYSCVDKKLSYRRRTARCVVSVVICQLPRNSAETTCTTRPEQIEVTKLKRYSKAMCSKHVHSTMTRSSRFRCPVNKPTTVGLCISPVYRRFAVHNVEIAHVTLTTPT